MDRTDKVRVARKIVSRRFLLTLGVALALVGRARSASAAALLTIDAGDNLSFSGSGVDNVTTVSYAAGTYTINDTAETISITNNGTGMVTGSGTNTVTVTNVATLAINGDGGDDSIKIVSVADPTSVDTETGNLDSIVIGNGSLAGIAANVSVQDSGSVGYLTIDDSADATARNVTITSSSVTGASVGSINILSGIIVASFDGGAGADQFSVSLSGGNDLVAFYLNAGGGADTIDVQALASGIFLYPHGNTPAPPANPGDTLQVNIPGVINPVLMSAVTPTGYSGSWTFDNAGTIFFTEMEELQPGGPPLGPGAVVGAPSLSPMMLCLLVLMLVAVGASGRSPGSGLRRASS